MNATFGIKGVQEHCFFLKSMEDAQQLRRHIRYLRLAGPAAFSKQPAWHDIAGWIEKLENFVGSPRSLLPNRACLPVPLAYAYAARRWSMPPCPMSRLRAAASCCPLWW